MLMCCKKIKKVFFPADITEMLLLLGKCDLSYVKEKLKNSFSRRFLEFMSKHSFSVSLKGAESPQGTCTRSVLFGIDLTSLSVSETTFKDISADFLSSVKNRNLTYVTLDLKDLKSCDFEGDRVFLMLKLVASQSRNMVVLFSL